MSTATNEPKARRRRRKQDPGPELPMKAEKPKPFGRIFRRKDRGARLYAAYRDAEGKLRVRSLRVSTLPAANQWLELMARKIEDEKRAKESEATA